VDNEHERKGMAEVSDVDPDLRALARRVPEDIRVNLSPLELKLRVEEASALLAEAEAAGDQVKGDRLRSRAGRLLKAVSPTTYNDIRDRLCGEISRAQLDGADRRAYEIQEELRAFERRNPQVDPARVMEAAWAALARGNGKLAVPAVPANNSLTRRFRRGRKGR
jgi:hypothetical protein